MPSPDRWVIADKHRRAQVAIASGTLDDLRRSWGLLDPGNLDGSFPAFARETMLSVQARRQVSAALGSSFYRTLRDAEGVSGSVTTALSSRVDPGRLLTSLRVTGPVTWKRALSGGADPSQAQATAFSAVQRSMSRHVLDGGRQTVMGSILRDDKAWGYQRISDGSPCAFCAMLISRGAVYRSQMTAGFDAHDGCGCSAVPFWERSPAMTAQAVRYRELWDASGARYSGTSARKAFRQAYEGKVAAPSVFQAPVARTLLDAPAAPAAPSEPAPAAKPVRPPVGEHQFTRAEAVAAYDRAAARIAKLDPPPKSLDPKFKRPGMSDAEVAAIEAHNARRMAIYQEQNAFKAETRRIYEEETGRALHGDALPRVVKGSVEDFESRAGDGLVYRVVRDADGGLSAQQIAEAYRSGSHYHGEGMYGSGTYFGTDLKTTLLYADDQASAALSRARLVDDARVAQIDGSDDGLWKWDDAKGESPAEAVNFRWRGIRAQADEDSDVWKEASLFAEVTESYAGTALAHGYDAIRISDVAYRGGNSAFRGGAYVVLNRGATEVLSVSEFVGGYL